MKLKLQPIHPHRLCCSETGLHEGNDADPELVVAAERAGGGWRAERADEEFVAVVGEAGLFHGARQGGGVEF